MQESLAALMALEKLMSIRHAARPSVDSENGVAEAGSAYPQQPLEMAVEQHAPPKSGLFRPKPRYAHQGGKNPPVIILHGNALEGLRDDYKRYLESSFRKAFKLQGTPLRIQVKEDTGKNTERFIFRSHFHKLQKQELAQIVLRLL